jgi:hypothetical protein
VEKPEKNIQIEAENLVVLSPAIVEKYLCGMHYPAEKKKLVDNAQNKHAPNDVLKLINKLPEKTYTSHIDITKEIGKIE